jgi:hypothetical protein
VKIKFLFSFQLSGDVSETGTATTNKIDNKTKPSKEN